MTFGTNKIQRLVPGPIRAPQIAITLVSRCRIGNRTGALFPRRASLISCHGVDAATSTGILRVVMYFVDALQDHAGRRTFGFRGSHRLRQINYHQQDGDLRYLEKSPSASRPQHTIIHAAAIAH